MNSKTCSGGVFCKYSKRLLKCTTELISFHFQYTNTVITNIILIALCNSSVRSN